jgi:hypothetical protein
MPKKNKDLDTLPVFEITFEDDGEQGIHFLSLVADPAIEIKGMYFNKSKEMQFKAVEDQQIVVGPAMVPEMKILRIDGDYEYYVFFSADTITQMVDKFNRENNNKSINVDHSNRMVDGFIKANWQIEDPNMDKSKTYGYENLKQKTWFVEIKINDKEFWENEVKDMGKFGFSIEGLMGTSPYQLTKQYLESDEFEKALYEFKSSLKNVGELSDDEYYDIYSDAVRGSQKGFRISYDYDGVLSTPQGQAQAANDIKNGNDVFVVTKRDISNQGNIYSVSDRLGIPRERVIFTDGKYKIKYLRNLFIDCHYDDTAEEIDKINRSTGVIGKLFKIV